jgi:tripartite-type tricarboxylate transporter receptor subunit TctC
LLAGAQFAGAENYPTKSMHFVVPYPAGATADIVARLMGQKAGDALGQRVVIDNRGGAGGIIGTEMVANAAPDGYTFLLAALSHAVNPSLYKKLPYDSFKDFSFVTLAVAVPNILVVHPSLPIRSVADLIAEAKRNPGKINYGSGGNGTSTHLAGELFRNLAKVDIVRVSYKGSAFAKVDLLAGQIQVMFDVIVASMPQVNEGKLRALAVTGFQRSVVAPNLPTIAEAGVPGYDLSGWLGVAAPARTSKDIVARLNVALRQALQSPEAKQTLTANGADIIADSPEHFTTYMRSEMAKWAKVVSEAGIKPE